MAPIPSPYPSGCKIARFGTRSYCSCAAGCLSEYPPPQKFVLNVQPTSKYPWSLFVGRRVMDGDLSPPVTCNWVNHGDPDPVTRSKATLLKGIESPSGALTWRLSFDNLPACIGVASTLVDGTNDCCTDLYYGLAVIWFSTLCFVGPGPNPEIDLWPVAFDFTESDL